MVTAHCVSALCSPTFRGGTRKLAKDVGATRGIFKKVSIAVDFVFENAARNSANRPRSKQTSGFAGDAEKARTRLVRVNYFWEFDFAGAIGTGWVARNRFTTPPTTRAESTAMSRMISWRVSFIAIVSPAVGKAVVFAIVQRHK
ncbi:MAG: hypothetical protein P4L99_20965 [Chthoniobacter sp.]|nr:hypothetical protein [Chthoniobacter sp.]